MTTALPSCISQATFFDAIYAGAKELYPRESFLLLRGKKSKGIIKITDLVLAPFAAHEKVRSISIHTCLRVITLLLEQFILIRPVTFRQAIQI